MYLPVNATSTFLSVVLLVDEVCPQLSAAQVWKHELACSKSYEFLIHNFYFVSGVMHHPELPTITLLSYL